MKVNSTVLTGLTLCLAIVLRSLCKLDFHGAQNLTKSLSLTHTAFALGCLPVALLILLKPESLYSIQPASGSTPSADSSILTTAGFVLSVALWASLTEEYIYRGTLLSLLRRLPMNLCQPKKDFLAVTISSCIFGCAHWPVWGFGISLGVAGLGMGFGIGYLATGERLLPLLIYHAVFDILSLVAALTFRS